jgi:hypothetical protein
MDMFEEDKKKKMGGRGKKEEEEIPVQMFDHLPNSSFHTSAKQHNT